MSTRTRSWDRRRPIRPEAGSRTSLQSAARCSGTRRARRSRWRPRPAPSASRSWTSSRPDRPSGRARISLVAVSSDVEQGIRDDRVAKVEALRRAGVDPYPARTPPRAEVATVRADHGGLEPGAESGQSLWLAGRITGRRGHGKAIFLDLADRTGQLQLHATLDVLGEDGLAAVADS